MKILPILLFFLIQQNVYAHVIVLNKKNPVASLTAEQVKEIYLGEKLRWDDNVPIHIVDYNSSYPTRINFTNNILGLSIARVNKMWIKLSLAGSSIPPKILRSEAEVVENVSNDPSAIGYVESTSGLNLGTVKVIKLEN